MSMNWICRVLSCSDWTEHENLGSSTALRWIEGYCIGHKPVTPSNKNERWSNKRYHCIDCVIVMELEILLFLVVSSCSCFGIFAIGLCLTEQEAKAPFFADQPVHTVRAFDRSRCCCQLPGLFVLEFQIQIKHRKETHVLPEKKTETSSSELWIWNKNTSWTLICNL